MYFGSHQVISPLNSVQIWVSFFSADYCVLLFRFLHIVPYQLIWDSWVGFSKGLWLPVCHRSGSLFETMSCFCSAHWPYWTPARRVLLLSIAFFQLLRISIALHLPDFSAPPGLVPGDGSQLSDGSLQLWVITELVLREGCQVCYPKASHVEPSQSLLPILENQWDGTWTSASPFVVLELSMLSVQFSQVLPTKLRGMGTVFIAICFCFVTVRSVCLSAIEIP